MFSLPSFFLNEYIREMMARRRPWQGTKPAKIIPMDDSRYHRTVIPYSPN